LLKVIAPNVTADDNFYVFNRNEIGFYVGIMKGFGTQGPVLHSTQCHYNTGITAIYRCTAQHTVPL
jgi:hypothetical protein